MALKYVKEIQLKIALVSLVVLLNCITSTAADEELTLENELEQAVPHANSTSATDEPVMAGKSEVEYEKDELQVQSIEQKYAMNGYSIGALFFNNNYNINVNMLSNNVPVNLTTKSPDIQSIGIMGRYAILPYDKFGTDINVAVATSVNHSNLNYTAISTLRAELNLGYAFLIGNDSAFYFLGGLGYEITKNAELEAILNPGGTTYQVGGGIGLGKNIDVEVFYSHVRHAIQDSYLEKAALSAQASGATVSYVSSESSVTSNVILGRLSYRY